MLFSRRTHWPSEQNLLAGRLEQKKRSGEPYLDLTESNPTRCGFDYQSLDLLRALSNPKNFDYAPDPRGDLKAREWICDYYAQKNISVTPPQVFLTCGSSQAYGFLFRLLAEPGEAFLTPSPGYPLLNYLADYHDAQLESYALQYQDRWEISPEDLEGAVSAKTRGIVVVNPNNPTGNYLSAKELQILTHCCQKHDLALISDEVFLDFPQKQASAKSLAGHAEVLTFTISGISKILALPQMKLGWLVVAGPDDLRRKAIERIEFMSDIFLSVNTPVQNALGAWMAQRGVIQEALRTRLDRNERSLRQKLAHHARCRVLVREGGWYAVIALPSECDEEALALDLLERGVLVHPGYLFDFKTPHWAVSLLPEEAVFQQAVDRISVALL